MFESVVSGINSYNELLRDQTIPRYLFDVYFEHICKCTELWFRDILLHRDFVARNS